MQPVALFTLEVAAVHAVILLEVADNGLDRLAPFQQFQFLGIELLALAPVLDRDAWVIGIHAPVTQVDIPGRDRRARGLGGIQRGQHAEDGAMAAGACAPGTVQALCQGAPAQDRT